MDNIVWIADCRCSYESTYYVEYKRTLRIHNILASMYDTLGIRVCIHGRLVRRGCLAISRALKVSVLT